MILGFTPNEIVDLYFMYVALVITVVAFCCAIKEREREQTQKEARKRHIAMLTGNCIAKMERQNHG